jgi:hypothetical protein
MLAFQCFKSELKSQLFIPAFGFSAEKTNREAKTSNPLSNSK